MFIKNYSYEFNIISFLDNCRSNFNISYFSLRENHFFFSVLIQIRFAVSQLLTLLRSWLRVNVNSRAFSSANEVDRVLSSANSTNLNKDDEFGRSFINIRNNNRPRRNLCGTPWRRRGGSQYFNYFKYYYFNYFKYYYFNISKILFKPFMWNSFNSVKIKFWK